jgi:hypothetical protein
MLKLPVLAMSGSIDQKETIKVSKSKQPVRLSEILMSKLQVKK